MVRAGTAVIGQSIKMRHGDSSRNDPMNYQVFKLGIKDSKPWVNNPRRALWLRWSSRISVR
jgi:hypothetical protein